MGVAFPVLLEEAILQLTSVPLSLKCFSSHLPWCLLSRGCRSYIVDVSVVADTTWPLALFWEEEELVLLWEEFQDQVVSSEVVYM